jgi:hypothetical protein
LAHLHYLNFGCHGLWSASGLITILAVPVQVGT